MFRTLDASLDTDLSAYSRLLWQQGISHRIVEHEGQQVLLIARQDQIAAALSLHERWQRGEASPAEGADGSLAPLFQSEGIIKGMWRNLRETPLTLLLIATCIALAFLAPLDGPSNLTYALLYPDISYGTRTIVLERVLANFGITDYLTMLTPILLHGGAMHLVFNMLWLWELGRHIEARQSTCRLALAIVVLALVSNTAQYLYGGGSNFGGMSGVVYGLFAYVWMWQLFHPYAGLRLQGPLIAFMLLSLVVMTLLELDMIANEAHLGGFLCGIVYGAATATISRIKQGRRHQA
jgi:GlpG protein